MKIDVDEISPVQRKVRVELPAETVAHEFSRAYQDLGRRVRVKGFRAGKTPRSVLQGIYGEELKGQVRSHLVEASLGEIIKERGLEIVSRPEIEANDLLEDRPFSFSAVFEVKPDIPVKDYLGIELQRVKLSVSDDQVEQALRRLQESHARLEPVENRAIVQRGDFVTLDFEGTIGGKPFSGGKGQNYFLEIGGGRALPQFEEALIGLKQDVAEKIHVVYPEHYPNNELSGRAVVFSVIVREIKQKTLPELDDDFAKDHGECASLQDLQAITRKRLEHELKQIQQEELKEQIISALIRSCPLTPPAAMVERQTRYLMERYHSRGRESGAAQDSTPSSEEARKTLERRALRQVQATLLLEKISQFEKIEVSDQDVQERVDNLARAAGEKGKTVREIYAKPDAREDLRAQLVFDRTLSFLLERAQIKDVESLDTKVDEEPKKG